MTELLNAGFFGEARQQVRALVEALGATYSGELVDGLSTHLVCAHGANCNGVLKVKKAQEWGIPVVRVEWLTDSEDVVSAHTFLSLRCIQQAGALQLLRN